MLAEVTTKVKDANVLPGMAHYLKRPLRFFRESDRSTLSADAVAGITVAVVLLPQAIAFALIAELPPQMGLYTAVVAGIVAALWGSSDQMFTGPANAISLLVLSALSGYYTPGSAEFVLAAGLLAVLAGIFQIGMGLARLGFLVNFVSHSVIVGFASGAGVLIAVKQLDTFLGISGGGSGLVGSLVYTTTHLGDIHWPTAEIGLLSVAILLVLRKLKPSLPGPLIAMVVASTAVYLLNLSDQGVAVIGQLSMGLPQFQQIPLFDLQEVGQLSTGALAVGAIALVQVTAITRSFSAQTGQRLDSNQEFVGQGLANIASGFFSGYNCAGSFSVSAVNFKAGAKSPYAAIFASLFVLIAMLMLGPLTAFLPRAALAGVLIITAYGMIDRVEIKRIWAAKGSDAVIMVVTLLGTLFLELEFAVLTGIMLSLAFYILKTSTPQVHAVLPDENFRHFFHQPGRDECPQLGIIEVLGDLYFGAVNHVEEFVLDHAEQHPEQRFLLLRMHNVNQCDFSGVHMLETIAKIYRDRGGDLFLVRPNPRVRKVMELANLDATISPENILDEDQAISFIFRHILDPAVCIYECPVRAFKECQNLPKQTDTIDLVPLDQVKTDRLMTVSPAELWQQLHPSSGISGSPPLVIDVREPREYRRGHIPEAELIPLLRLMQDGVTLPPNRDIVLVCRSSRRSRRAAYTLQKMGAMHVRVLEGGMIAWEAAGLLEALD